ncbi:MAG: SDR family NAD(P)-dependent oxidoreductase [Gammaproteobacteria bacterium]|nr:SDR family NAD(P)-dependent oxidoreductase [Gammaproteobacteria bacterium]
MREFEGKTAVVTGAASGIGLALAHRFAQARMNVVLADIEEEALERTVNELKERQAQVLGVPTNTMVLESVQALAERAIDAFGKIHVLCNNAGVASPSARTEGIWEAPNSDWEWVMGVNFYGVLYGLQVFVPHMLEHGEEGHVVNTASLAGLIPGGGIYGVSKHGVLVLTETLYNDLRARDAAIGASVLCPGFVNTNIANAERNRPAELTTESSETSSEMLAMAQGLLAQGKEPSEIADAVFESIEQERLYVLPHPAWDDQVRSRVEHVIQRQGPAVMDLEKMMKRRAEGEQF